MVIADAGSLRTARTDATVHGEVQGTAKVHISRLREKPAGDPRAASYVVNVRMQGYGS